MFGAEITGLDPKMLHDPATCRALRDLFERKSLLVFHDLEIDQAGQVALCEMLRGLTDTVSGDARSKEHRPQKESYVSNKKSDSAAPFGRLLFHGDTMWADSPYEVLSLYGVDVGQPVAPTIFVSAVHAWETLPADLRAQAEGKSARHIAGGVDREGDRTDVLIAKVERPPSTVKPLGLKHPRTGKTILYACEQMTESLEGMPHAESEALLQKLFAHLYAPANVWEHQWREGDLVVWDNLALQHARPNVTTEGPARTLRKVATPVPQLSKDQLPSFSMAEKY
jgi:alpha-ketoglutarate-dependent taurine dioxygenase